MNHLKNINVLYVDVFKTKFLTKVAPIISNFLGYFGKPHSYVKTAMDTFWATVGKNWPSFYSNSWSHWLRVL